MVTSFSPTVNRDGWQCHLSDGSLFTQDDAPGHLSAWNRLKDHCTNQNVHIIRMFLTVGQITIEVVGNAAGYWQAQKMAVSMDDPSDDPQRHWRGIGHVDRNGIVQIRWLGYPNADRVGLKGVYTVLDDKGFCVALAANESRLAHTQNNVIWSPRSKVRRP